MVGLMMADPVTFGIETWLAAMAAALVLGALGLVVSKLPRKWGIAVVLAILTAILIVHSTYADDFACPTCGCAWWWC